MDEAHLQLMKSRIVVKGMNYTCTLCWTLPPGLYMYIYYINVGYACCANVSKFCILTKSSFVSLVNISTLTVTSIWCHTILGSWPSSDTGNLQIWKAKMDLGWYPTAGFSRPIIIDAAKIILWWLVIQSHIYTPMHVLVSQMHQYPCIIAEYPNTQTIKHTLLSPNTTASRSKFEHHCLHEFLGIWLALLTN